MRDDEPGNPHTHAHPDPTILAAVALGEAVSQSEQEHIAMCVACMVEVDALWRALGKVRDAGPDRLVAPPERVWAAIAREVDALPQDPVIRRIHDIEPDQRSTPPTLTTGGRRFSVGWLAAACVAGILLGGVGGATLGRQLEEPTSTSPEVVTLATAKLDTLDARKAELGQARLIQANGELDVDIDTAGFSADGGYLEVWLINEDLKRMVSIGVLRPERRAQQFAIDSSLIQQGYTILDISRESFDNKPQHSGDSIVRGTLT